MSVGEGLWLALGWLGSYILQHSLKRAVSPSRTPVVSSFSYLTSGLGLGPWSLPDQEVPGQGKGFPFAPGGPSG